MSFSPIPGFQANGNLPIGRYATSLTSAKQRLVSDVPSSISRPTIWADFLDAVASIKNLKARVPAAFIGGSFVTAKVDPDDIDICSLVDVSRITQPSTYQGIVRRAQNFKTIGGLRVDGFIVPWDAQGDEAKVLPDYLAARGKWDDWWQRDVPKAERQSPVRRHAMPVRGYLEVEIDGYK